MKITALIIFFIPMFAIANPTLDEIEQLKCTVEESSVNSSFIPPQIGDTKVFSLWALNVSDMKFVTAQATESYLSLPASLERVDHSDLRTPHLRTFIGIKESAAYQLRKEATLELRSISTELTAVYSEKSRSLPNGTFKNEDFVRMSCKVQKLWK